MKKVRTIILLAGLMMGLITVCAHAQGNTVTPGTSFDVAWDHDGLNSPSFRIIVDGAIVRNWTAAEVIKSTTADPVTNLFTYSATVPVPGLSFGVHALVIEAYNAVGKNASAPLSVTAGSSPSQPKNFRIKGTLTVAADGTVTFKLDQQ